MNAARKQSRFTILRTPRVRMVLIEHKLRHTIAQFMCMLHCVVGRFSGGLLTALKHGFNHPCTISSFRDPLGTFQPPWQGLV